MEEITRYTKLHEIELPSDWSDEDYLAAVKHIDDFPSEVSDKDAEFLESLLKNDRPLTERQKQWVYKLFKLYG